MEAYFLYVITFVVVVLQYLDYHTTRTILKNGGVEQNPIIKWFMGKIGIDATLIIKGAIVSAVAYFAGTQTLVAPVIMAAIYVWVIIHNNKSMPHDK